MSFFRFFFVLSVVFTAFVFGLAQELPERQRGLADRYTQLEQVLLRMSEASASSNPRRAELLKKVLRASKDRLMTLRLGNVAAVLERRQLTEAISGQEEIEKDLLELLKILESENREQRRNLEKEKIKEFLRDLEEIIHQERALKARTSQEEAEKIAPMEKNQREIRLRAGSLRDRIEESETPDAKSSDAGDSKEEAASKQPDDPDGKKGDENKENEEKEKGDEKKKTDGRQESEKSDNVSKDEGSNKNDSKESDAAPEESASSESEEAESDGDSPNDSPTRKAMKKALRRMRQAEQKLQKTEKSGALEEQEEAIAELQRVKAELEKILRQLREEEVLQTLEKLEARFKRMLRIEQSIRSQTEKIGAASTSADETEQRQARIQASRLSTDQQSVLDDADAALVLLREDGTAQAMVESLLQARFDMEEIKGRLDRTQLDAVTLDVEDAVIAALQEMLEAIDMAIKETEKRKENPPPADTPDGGGPGEEPLIQMLSELRMIRSMQQRVNQRTQRCEKAVEESRKTPGADLESLRKTVEELARQQNRISRILHDLKTGRAD